MKTAADQTQGLDVLALHTGPRLSWGLAIRLFVQILAAAAIAVMMGPFAPARPFLAAGLVFLGLRIIGDLARAFAGDSVVGMLLEGHAKAAAWAVLVIGMLAAAEAFDPGTHPWQVGLALALAGFSLWGHHVHAERVSLRLAKEEGVLGCVVGTVGAAMLATAIPLPAPWEQIVPLAVLVIGGALAARAILGLVRRTRKRDPRSDGGWMAWYQENFFRLTLLAGLVVVYLFVRDGIADVVPLLFIWEYSFAVFALGTVLWSLRSHLAKRLVPHPLSSPHTRHEQAVERQGETSFDQVEHAIGEFLERGDASAVAGVADSLESEGVPVGRSLAPITSYQRDPNILLVHPGWLYGARLLTVFLVALGFRTFVSGIPADGEPGAILPLLFGLVLGVGVYAAQWNRFGGPWWVKTGIAYVGLLIFFFTDRALASVNQDAQGLLSLLMSNPVGIGVLLLFLALPLVHPWRASRGSPRPRYGYVGNDPLGAIRLLRKRAEASLVRRSLWALGLGIIVFIAIGEITRFVPALAVLFNLYLIGAAMAVLQPLLVTAGLRLGTAQVRTRFERERVHRQQILTHSLASLEQTLGAPQAR